MLANRHSYQLYRKNNLSSNEWGEVVSQKEIIKENLIGGVPQLTIFDINEDKYSTKTYGLRLVVDELIEPTLSDVYISNGTKEWRVTQIIPYETFFKKTVFYLNDRS